MSVQRTRQTSKRSSDALPRYLHRYIFDVIELKQSIEFNRRDGAFAEGRASNGKLNEIIYIVDADVACMFLSPRDGVESVDLFGALGRPRDREPGVGERRGHKDKLPGKRSGQFEGLAELSAAVCAEYLFSGQLPGQRSGLARISYQHVFELENFLNRQLAHAHLRWNEAERALKDNIAQIKKNLENQWALLDIDKMAPEQAASALSQNLPEGLREWLLVNALSVHQFRRLTKTGKERLAPLDGLSSFQSGMETPSPDIVGQWYTLIEQHRSIEPVDTRSQTAQRGRSDRNYRDAVVMAQVQALNAVAEPHESFVFVTGSSTVHKAVGHWNAEHPNSADRVNFVRHPRQYVALLNMRDIRRSRSARPNDPLANESILLEILETVNTILKTFLEDEVVDKLAVGFKVEELQRSLERKLKPFDASRDALRKFTELRDRLRDQWVRLTRAAVAYSRGALADMCDPIFDVVRKVIDQRNDIVDRALLDQCKNLVEGISKNNTLMGVLGALAILATRMEATKNRRVGQRRSPAWIRYDFRGLIPQDERRELNDFLEEVINSRSAFDSVVSWLSDTQRRASDANFLIGCIFLKADDWAHARHFLEKAEADLCEETSNTALYEVKYCLAVAIRLSLKDEADFLACKQLNEACLRFHAAFENSNRPHTFRAARTFVELGAINAAWVSTLSMRTERMDPGMRNACNTLLAKASAYLREAQHAFDEHFREDRATRDLPRVRQVYAQLATNRAGMLTMREFLLDESEAIQNSPDVEEIKRELANVIQRDNQSHSLTKLCFLLLVWKTHPVRDEAHKAANEARDLISKALYVSSPGISKRPLGEAPAPDRPSVERGPHESSPGPMTARDIHEMHAILVALDRYLDASSASCS